MSIFEPFFERLTKIFYPRQKAKPKSRPNPRRVSSSEDDMGQEAEAQMSDAADEDYSVTGFFYLVFFSHFPTRNSNEKLSFNFCKKTSS